MKRLISSSILIGSILLVSGCCESSTNQRVAHLVDAAVQKRQVEEDTARSPGFEVTRICGRDVLRIATERAQSEKIELSHFRTPSISLNQKNGKMIWVVSWFPKGISSPGMFFRISVDDETGRTEVIGGS
jgi:hypothetical protein